MTHYATLTLTALAPLMLLELIALLAIPLFIAGTYEGWRGLRAAMDRCGFRYYATIVMLFHTSICVKLFSHFNCHGPYEDETGKERRHLATDYSIKCDDDDYSAYSGFVTVMLFVYVLVLPLGALLWLKSNRPAGRVTSPRELAELDGVLAPLAEKYTQPYWWFELAGVAVRLCYCGGAVFIFPTHATLRCALCLIVVTAYAAFSLSHKPVAQESSRAVSVLAHALLFLLALAAIVSTNVASERVQVGYSCALFVFTIAVGACLRQIKAKETEHKLAAAISAREPFDQEAFEARSSAYLYDAVALQARDIVREPTSAGMAYLKTQLAPLDSVWPEEIPAEIILKDCATTVEALLANLDADATLEARLKYVFNDVVDFSAFLKASDESILLSLEVLVDFFKGARWTRFTRLRLEALWAMRKTTGGMELMCRDVLAVEPFGTMLRELKDIKGDSELPVFRRDDVAELIKSLAPNAPESYLQSVDQKALPELLKSLATVVFPELQAHIWGLIPGGRT